ncbi:helix-turn-helix transcriptional regulator [Chitinophaga sp. OAE865]
MAYAYIVEKYAYKAVMADQVFNRIKAVLAEKGRTNNWLAETLEMNRNTVSKWCTNQMQPTIETLFKIAQALDVEARDLLVLRKTK